jgi:hypothetical protein
MCTNHLKKKYYSEAQALQWAIHIAKGLNYLHTARPKVSAWLHDHRVARIAEIAPGFCGHFSTLCQRPLTLGINMG